MAKLSMKDYENFLKEEARQDRLQEELEDRRKEESWEAEENWQDYQRSQEEERRRNEFNSYSEYYEYFDEDDFDDEEEVDLESIDPFEGDLFYGMQEVEEDTVDEKRISTESIARNPQEDRICRKAVARNRHLNKVKAKNSASRTSQFIAERKLREALKKEKKLADAFFSNRSNVSDDKVFKQFLALTISINYWCKVLESLDPVALCTFPLKRLGR